MLLLLLKASTNVGTSAGVATVTAVGASIAAAPGSAAGIATVSGQGKPIAAGLGSAAGIAAATGVGAQLASAAGTAAGDAEAEATGRALGVPHEVINQKTDITQAGIRLSRTTKLAA